MSTVCIGTGSHALDLAAIWSRAYPLAPALRRVEENDFRPSTASRILIGFVNPRSARREVRDRWAHVRSAEPLVDPTAERGPKVRLGMGVVVSARALLLTDVTLGEHVHVNYGAMMTRVVVRDFTTIGPGAIICGDVYIGSECQIGAGAVIKNLVTIGNGVTIGAGAVVVRDVPHGATVKGVPAR